MRLEPLDQYALRALNKIIGTVEGNGGARYEDVCEVFEDLEDFVEDVECGRVQNAYDDLMESVWMHKGVLRKCMGELQTLRRKLVKI